jgi:hypothetical protein
MGVPFSLRTVSFLVAAGLITSSAEGSDNIVTYNPAITTSSGSGGGEKSSLTFTALTKPLPLFPGEVTNTWHHLNIPKGPIAISEFAADIVEEDPITGEIIAVPLSDAYLHHHVVYSSHKYYEKQKHRWSPMKPENANRGVGFGAGTESRGTKQKFPFPYRFTTVEGEDELVANVHVINTRSMRLDHAHHCLECPCTIEDRVSLVGEDEEEETKHKDGWFHWNRKKKPSLKEKDNTTLLESVIKRRPNWTSCNIDLVDEKNTACFPETYYGGLICCEHGEFCLDNYYMSKDQIAATDNSTQSVFYLRYTLTYTPMTPEVKPLYLAACCDASGNETSPGNIEYDIPKLCDGFDDDEACIHNLETIQSLHGASRTGFGTSSAENEEDIYVDVVYMVGHLHRGGISMSAYFEGNNSLLCESLPTYGTGEPGEIGNEPGYINSMSTCTFDPPLRMKTTDKIRVVGKYNASEAHTGVMSLFYIAVSDVPTDKDGDVTPETGGFWKHFQPLAIFVAAGIVIGATWHVARKIGLVNRRRAGYEALPGNGHSISV